MAEQKSIMVKYGGSTIGIGSGNAIAYFGLPHMEKIQGFSFDDPVVAVAMGGALVSILILELGKLGRGLRYVFDRFFPEKPAP